MPKAATPADSWLDLEEDIPAMPVLNSLTKNRARGPLGQRKPTKVNGEASAEPANTTNAAASESDPIPSSSGSFLIANELAKDAEKRIKVKRSTNEDEADKGQEGRVEEDEPAEDDAVGVQTLPSLTKGRVKTPMKRPPSRRKNKEVSQSSLAAAEVTASEDVEVENKAMSMPIAKSEEQPKGRLASNDASDKEEALRGIEAGVVTLPSLTKERAKTPNRRPPSRKKNKGTRDNSLVTANVTDSKEEEDKGKSRSMSKPNLEAKPMDSGNVNNDSAIEDIGVGVETLPSLTKERAKTPKKRPPSRNKTKELLENNSTLDDTVPKDESKPTNTKPGTNPANRRANKDGDGSVDDTMRNIEAQMGSSHNTTIEEVKMPIKKPPPRRANGPGRNSEPADPEASKPLDKPEAKARALPKIKSDEKPEGKEKTCTSSISSEGTKKSKGKADVKKGKRIIISRKRTATEETKEQGSLKIYFLYRGRHWV